MYLINNFHITYFINIFITFRDLQLCFACQFTQFRKNFELRKKRIRSNPDSPSLSSRVTGTRHISVVRLITLLLQ